ncbi:MAG TPA: AzlD domain-containing protein [Actinomycetota bacterium]|nr:AzlD domain-containing protein [Actinomycetota bacterium]
MTEAWIVVGVVGAATVAIKAVGPVFLGGRPLPPRLQGLVRLLAPAVLAALVATGVLASGRDLVVDARLIGVGVAVVALVLRAPILVVVVVAAAATALARLAGIA